MITCVKTNRSTYLPGKREIIDGCLTADLDCCCRNAHTLHIGQRDQQVSLRLYSEPRSQTVVVLNANDLRKQTVADISTQ